MIIVTHPGKLGDLLWALPTVRAIAQKEPVKLWLSAWCAPLVPLLEQQDYISAVYVDPRWAVLDTAPTSPRIPPGFEDVKTAIHLGYGRWPVHPLPFEIAWGNDDVSWEPWITARPGHPKNDLLITWTDRWFELKFGITVLLRKSLQDEMRGMVIAPPESRWVHEAGWKEAAIDVLATAIGESRVVLTDCSMAHVLAAAMGKRVVVMEPEHDRHHFIFWPGCLGVGEPQARWTQAPNYFGQLIFPVLGNDGRPTFDARHTRELIEKLLEHAHA